MRTYVSLQSDRELGGLADLSQAIRETTIHSREAQIAAERAEEAARRAAMANAIVQSSLEALAAIAAQNGEDGLALPV